MCLNVTESSYLITLMNLPLQRLNVRQLCRHMGSHAGVCTTGSIARKRGMQGVYSWP